MGSALRYEDFDFLGVIRLMPDEVTEDIEEFLTPVKDKQGNVTHYLSRSSSYYREGLTYTDRAKEYEYLKSIFPHDDPTSKKAFVVAEHMANHSARIFFSEVIKKIFFNGNNNYDVAREAFINDCAMVRDIVRGQDTTCHTLSLPKGNWITEGRQIELDNKALIDIFTRSIALDDPQNTLVLTPGFGSLFLGPFMQLESDGELSFENAYLSVYAKGSSDADALVKKLFSDSDKNLKEQIKSGEISISQLMTNGSNYVGRTDMKCLVLDDNMGTGVTAKIIADAVKRDLGIDNCAQMATVNNWVNFAKVYFGNQLLRDDLTQEERTDITDNKLVQLQDILNKHNTDSDKLTRTDITNPDFAGNPNIFPSPINFPDYKLLKELIEYIKKGGENAGINYETRIAQFNFGNVIQNDILTCMEVGDKAKALVPSTETENPNLDATLQQTSDNLKHTAIIAVTKPGGVSSGVSTTLSEQ